MEWLVGIILVVLIISMIGKSMEKAEAEKKKKDMIQKRKEAEDYIFSSGDPEAIKMLMLARANPANYSQVLQGGMNKGNDTLKTALGVMAGVAAGNLVSNAITAAAISSALEDMGTEMAESGIDPDETEADLADASGDDDLDFDIFS